MVRVCTLFMQEGAGWQPSGKRCSPPRETGCLGAGSPPPEIWSQTRSTMFFACIWVSGEDIWVSRYHKKREKQRQNKQRNKNKITQQKVCTNEPIRTYTFFVSCVCFFFVVVSGHPDVFPVHPEMQGKSIQLFACMFCCIGTISVYLCRQWA